MTEEERREDELPDEERLHPVVEQPGDPEEYEERAPEERPADPPVGPPVIP
ncbi:MAG: hypothetical protein ACRDM8_07380 [Gaiellaceae bacterium]